VLVPVLFTVFKPLAGSWYRMIVLLSVLTMIIGNLFALRQENIKRLLAFSSITQVGFILIGISGSSQAGAASVVYFVLVYLFSNLGAFGVVALISAFSGKERLEDYNGLYDTNPFLSWILALALFSLAGIPPTAGFFGKFFLLMSGAEKGNYTLITIAALNMIISLYYYLRIIRAVFMEKSANPIQPVAIPSMARLGLWLCVLGILFLGLSGWIYHYIFSLSIPF
jgi:NADH-quinone oxidoreductase subunit N